ncbi:MAG: hypothetical protein QOF78_553 [Phycisphaerales bacterium]|nr:hypothetical protein [Phycisphaerales bacterium]
MSHAQLTFACTPENDLFKLCSSAKRFDTAAAAIEGAAEASGVLILADGYPQQRIDMPAELLERAKRKKLRLYIEYPRSEGDAQRTQWERGVIASDFFGDALPKMRIVAPHECHFVALETPGTPHLVLARVAGYDTAVYGLPKESFPLLIETPDGNLIATTKLSGFVTARFAPTAEWKRIWRTILKKLDPQHEPPTLDHQPLVRPSNSTDEPESFRRAAAFYLHSRLLITPDRRDEIHRLLKSGVEEIAPPSTDANGDGTLGMIEGYASHIRPDGSQMQRTPIRADCNAEAAMVLALSADARSKQVAANLLDYTFGPEMQSLGRLDPAHPAFGLIAWGAISGAWTVGNYGDDNARVLLATILASAGINSDRWDEHVCRALLANLRTTGTLGFRGDRVDIGPLEKHGWKHFRDAETINYSPHFESGLWACYLWAYARTGDKEFLDRTTNAIRMSMDAYAKTQWRWNDNMERSRMLLCLAWLVRVDDRPEHRAWLTTIATDLLAAQHESGAIADRLANAGGGHYQIPRSNEAYGTSETPLIQKNGDPVSDQLYATGFALLGLHEAAAATGDEKLRTAEDKLAAYLCRIQLRSEKLPYLDGAWFRAFDFGRWDFYASSADMGWGAWSVEAGWGPAWTAATLALRERKTTMWEMTATSRMKEQLPRVREEMSKNDGKPLVPR